MKRSEILFSALLVPLDFLAVLAGFVLAYYIRTEGSFIPPDALSFLAPGVEVIYGPGGAIMPLANYLHYVWYIIPAMLVIFALNGLYTMRSSTPWGKRLLQILIGVTGGEFFILLLFLLKRDFFLPRSTILYSWILATLAVFLVRLIVRLIQKQLYRYNIGAIRVGIVGSSEAADTIMASLNKQQFATYRLTRRYELSLLTELLTSLTRDEVDEVIVVNEQYNKHDLVAIRNHCLEQHIAFSFVPALFSVLHSSYGIRTGIGMPVIEVLPTPLEGWGRVLKRLFDIVGSLFFIVLFSPFYIAICLAIWITSPGPLIFKQPRIGKGGKMFNVWKFRSLQWQYCDGKGTKNAQKLLEKYFLEHPEQKEEWDRTHKLAHDPRASVIGRFLRRTSLDEIPQFFNVLLGQMSLVGPRPIIASELEAYGEMGRIMFTVKPGVTGPWQVEGRGELSFSERADLNAQYIEHWSLLRDIVILAKTAVSLLFNNRGAY